MARDKLSNDSALGSGQDRRVGHDESAGSGDAVAYEKSMMAGWWQMWADGKPCWRRGIVVALIVPTLVMIILGIYLTVRFGSDSPVVHDDPEEHFKYGSTGGERESGFPYWIFKAMPQVCDKHLPGKGYESLGMIFEKDHDLPIGMSKRSYQGIERTFLNCAVCHTSTVRDTVGSMPRIITGMPANTFNIMGFQKFFFACGKDQKFSTEYVVPEVRRLIQENHKLHPEAPEDLDMLERTVVYPVAIAIMRERLIMLADRFAWADRQHEWGPGRVDTFNAAKVLFNFPMHKLGEHEQNAPSDFPSIWNQAQREGMQLHWDGNNTKVEERNKSAAFGTGTTPPTLDVAAIGRVEKWLLTKDAPKFPYPIDSSKAARGAPIYNEYCAECHGAGPRNFAGEYVGKVTPIARIGTDRHRLDSYSYELAVNQSTLYVGYDWRFTHFRKTFGYANMPLDGLWLRAPYLHNGSVPNLRELLEPTAKRSAQFYRGYDVYDPVNVGFVGTVAAEGEKKYFRVDTKVPGNSNVGHEGKEFGTELPPGDKDLLLEYLKTF
jgi:mono/diheme cytochrome c family protein